MSFLPATFANSPENIITIHYLMPHREETYSYDKVGNRLAQSITQKGTETRSSQYGENKVLLMHNGKTGYVYDILGNLIEKGSDYTYNEVTQTSTVQPSTQDYRRYHYDLFGRMKEVWGVDPETQSLVLLAEYVYDFRGMRIAKIKDGHITRYHLDEEGRNLETETTDESVTTAWIGQKPLGYTDNEGTYWYISDHQGSTFMLTDGEGNILWEDAVNPFGITAGSRGTQDSQVLYTGKIFDADADLYYFNARWYDPETGRFASEDPARDGVNWYAYVGNNPLKYTDPTGLYLVSPLMIFRQSDSRWSDSFLGDTPNYDDADKEVPNSIGLWGCKFIAGVSVGVSIGIPSDLSKSLSSGRPYLAGEFDYARYLVKSSNQKKYFSFIKNSKGGVDANFFDSSMEAMIEVLSGVDVSISRYYGKEKGLEALNKADLATEELYAIIEFVTDSGSHFLTVEGLKRLSVGGVDVITGIEYTEGYDGFMGKNEKIFTVNDIQSVTTIREEGSLLSDYYTSDWWK